MLLILSQEHKEHLGFLSHLQEEGTHRLNWLILGELICYSTCNCGRLSQVAHLSVLRLLIANIVANCKNNLS